MNGYFVGLADIVCFALAAKYLKLPQITRNVGATSLEAFATLRRPDLSDDEKERAAQTYAKASGRLFVSVVTRTAGALAVPCGMTWLLAKLRLVELRDISNAFL